MNSMRLLMIVTVVSCLGCSRTVAVQESARRDVVVVKEEKGPAARSAKRLGIPPGHLPPPGLCRIWYPGVPPGRQPSPGGCSRLARRIPPGAWLIERSRQNPDVVRVSECDQRKADFIVAIRIYDIASGKCVRED